MERLRGRLSIGLALLVSALPALSQAPAKALWSVTSFGSNDFFQEPSDIEVDDARSLIYVVDAGSARVLVFDVRGGFRRAIGTKGQGPGEFARPTGAGLLPGGGLAVADPGANRIQVFDAAGTYVRSVVITGPRAADVAVLDGLYYTVPSFGQSGYAVAMGSTDKGQPLVNVYDGDGKIAAEISTGEFPEAHPFVRAIKHRVSLAPAPGKDGRLFLAYFASGLVQVFDKTGRKAGAFSRPLPFKPRTPALVGERSAEGGVVQMRAELDFVGLAAKFGPDGKLDILTVTEGLEAVRRRDPGLKDPLPMRLDVVNPATFKTERTIACGPGIKAFGLLAGGRLVCVGEDADGELALRCVRY